VLTADAQLEVGLDRPTLLGTDPHQLADAVAVDRGERVVPQDPPVDVGREEGPLGVVPGDADRGLRQVVGAEAEEVGVGGDLVRADRCARPACSSSSAITVSTISRIRSSSAEKATSGTMISTRGSPPAAATASAA